MPLAPHVVMQVGVLSASATSHQHHGFAYNNIRSW